MPKREPLPIHCERCGEKLDEKAAVWMEMNCMTALFYREEGKVPEDESQGWFSFGKACAKRVEAAGGELNPIRNGRDG
jgi:hypothetical protein